MKNKRIRLCSECKAKLENKTEQVHASPIVGKANDACIPNF